jgi:ubiquinone/menaquinone biosynthesis C-methylase UbiE
MSATPSDTTTKRFRGYWDKHAPRYDRQMRFFERKLFGDTRAWICQQATGQVLEVAIGTGLNLEHYPNGIRLTGIDFSPAMLERARDRARQLGRTVDLQEGDAHALPFPDDVFDTVVCTFSLCAIPDEPQAIAEMRRVLRPGGRLLLADHVASSARWARALQWLLDRVTIPLGGEHNRRRPLEQVRAQRLEVERQERFKLGIVERLAARKPTTSPTR